MHICVYRSIASLRPQVLEPFSRPLTPRCCPTISSGAFNCRKCSWPSKRTKGLLKRASASDCTCAWACDGAEIHLGSTQRARDLAANWPRWPVVAPAASRRSWRAVRLANPLSLAPLRLHTC